MKDRSCGGIARGNPYKWVTVGNATQLSWYTVAFWLQHNWIRVRRLHVWTMASAPKCQTRNINAIAKLDGQALTAEQVRLKYSHIFKQESPPVGEAVRNATTLIPERQSYIMFAITCSENVYTRTCIYLYARLERHLCIARTTVGQLEPQFGRRGSKSKNV